MNFKKCNRCGSFYSANGDVCPRCASKENFELQTFRTYIESATTDVSVNQIACDTGILEKNVNRFLSYDEFKYFNNK